MPLSEHEQRLLEQIESALYAEDPKFASIYQGTDVRTHYRRHVIRALVGLIVGLAVLLAGVVIPQIEVGVAGFVIMLVAVSFGVASWQRMTGHRVAMPRERSPVKAGRGPKPAKDRREHGGRRDQGDRRDHGGRRDHRDHGPKRSVAQRLEDRWQRRQEERFDDR